MYIASFLTLVFFLILRILVPKLPEQEEKNHQQTVKDREQLTTVTAHPNEVLVEESYEFYEITGDSANELINQMEDLGPEDTEGKFWAYTNWSINWDYPFIMQDGRCVLYQPVSVSLKVTYQFPRWNPSQNSPEALAEKWNDFSDRLILHEKGHRDIAYRYAEMIKREFAGMDSYPDCEKFLAALDETGFRFIENAGTEEKAYDRQTGHGKTQGAIFE